VRQKLVAGYIDTPLLSREGIPVPAMESRHACGPIRQAGEMTAAAAWLLSDDAAFCWTTSKRKPRFLLNPVACVVHGLDVLGLRPGVTVLLFGAGPTGLILTQLLAGSGANELTVAAPTQAKLDLARVRGADRTVLGTAITQLLPSRNYAKPRRTGFDVVIDATGALVVLAQTLALTRTGGTVFVYEMTPQSTVWPIAPYDIFRRELTIKGSFAQQFSFDRALSALRNGRVKTEGMISKRFTLGAYDEALAAVADSSVVKALIVP
jgi:D-arabinitol dehydrogenase (NADP+)